MGMFEKHGGAHCKHARMLPIYMMVKNKFVNLFRI